MWSTFNSEGTIEILLLLLIINIFYSAWMQYPCQAIPSTLGAHIVYPRIMHLSQNVLQSMLESCFQAEMSLIAQWHCSQIFSPKVVLMQLDTSSKVLGVRFVAFFKDVKRVSLESCVSWYTLSSWLWPDDINTGGICYVKYMLAEWSVSCKLSGHRMAFYNLCYYFRCADKLPKPVILPFGFVF